MNGLIRHNDAPCDGLENCALADLPTPDNSQSGPPSEWTSTLLKAKNRGDNLRTVSFVVPSCTIWCNPRLILCGEHSNARWTVVLKSPPTDQMDRIDSNLCTLLATRGNKHLCKALDADEDQFARDVMMDIPLPFAQETEVSLPRPSPPDEIVFEFEDGVDTSKIAVLITLCSDHESFPNTSDKLQKRILSYSTDPVTLHYDEHGFAEWAPPFTHIGNCLLIHVDDEHAKEDAFDRIELFIKPRQKDVEVLFMSAEAEAIALQKQRGWFALPMSDRKDPQDVAGNSSYGPDITLNGSRCDLRLQFSTKRHMTSKVNVTLYWQHFNIQQNVFGVKSRLFA